MYVAYTKPQTANIKDIITSNGDFTFKPYVKQEILKKLEKCLNAWMKRVVELYIASYFIKLRVTTNKVVGANKFLHFKFPIKLLSFFVLYACQHSRINWHLRVTTIHIFSTEYIASALNFCELCIYFAIESVYNICNLPVSIPGMGLAKNKKNAIWNKLKNDLVTRHWAIYGRRGVHFCLNISLKI